MSRVIQYTSPAKTTLTLTPGLGTGTETDFATLAEQITHRNSASDPVALDSLVTVLAKAGEGDPYRRASALFGALRTLTRSHTTSEELENLGSRGQVLAKTLAGWREELARQEKWLVDDLLWEAIPSPSEVTVIGFDMFSRTQARFLNRFCGDGSTVVIPNGVRSSYAAEILGAFGDWTVTRSHEVVASQAKVERFLFSHEGDEIDWAVARAKHALLHEGFKSSEIAFLLTTPESYLTRLSMTADNAGLPTTSSLGSPLSMTEVGHIIRGLLTRNRGPVDSVTTDIERRLNTRSRTAPKGTAAWGEFVVWLSEQLREELDDRTASVRNSPAARRLVDSYVIALNSLDPLSNRLTRFDDFAPRAALVAQRIRTPRAKSAPGITLLSPDTFLSNSFRLLIVVGARAGSLPPPLANDPTLPFTFYKRLPSLAPPLTLAAIQRERTESLLLGSTSQLVMCAPSELNGERADPTMWPAVERKWQQAPKLALASCMSKEIYQAQLAERTEHVRRGTSIERERLSSQPFNEYDGIVGVNLTAGPLSVSEILELGRCGFKWLMGHRLVAHRPEVRSLEPDPAQIGMAIHRVLELVVTRQLPVPVDVDQAEALLAKADHSVSLTPAWNLRRREIARWICETTSLPEFRTDEASEVLTEYPVTAKWHDLEVKGRLDRVDLTRAGTWTILDYKSRSTTPQGVVGPQGKLDSDPQLAMYSELLLLADDMTVGDSYYVLVRSARAQRSSTKMTDEYLSELARRVRTMLATGSTPPLPDIDRISCRGCDFAHACRIGPRVELRREVADATHH